MPDNGCLVVPDQGIGPRSPKQGTTELLKERRRIKALKEEKISRGVSLSPLTLLIMDVPGIPEMSRSVEDNVSAKIILKDFSASAISRPKGKGPENIWEDERVEIVGRVV